MGPGSTKLLKLLGFLASSQVPGWFCIKASLTYINWPLTHRKTTMSFYLEVGVF